MSIYDKLYNINNDIINAKWFIDNACTNYSVVCEVEVMIQELISQRNHLLIRKERKDKLCQLMIKYSE